MNKKMIEYEDFLYNSSTYFTRLISNGKSKSHNMTFCTEEEYRQLILLREQRNRIKKQKIRQNIKNHIESKIDNHEIIERYQKYNSKNIKKNLNKNKKFKKKNKRFNGKAKHYQRKYLKHENIEYMYIEENIEFKTTFDKKLDNIEIVSKELFEEKEYLSFCMFKDLNIIYDEIPYKIIYENNMIKLMNFYKKKKDMIKYQKVLYLLNNFLFNTEMYYIKLKAEWYFNHKKNNNQILSDENHFILETYKAYYRLTYSKIFYKKILNTKCIDYSQIMIDNDIELMINDYVNLIINN